MHNHSHGRIFSARFCDESKKEDKPKEDTNKEPKPKSAINRLNELLASMSKEESVTLVKKVQIPKAIGRKGKQEQQALAKEKAEKPQNIIEATKTVAASLGGDTKRTESELLSKLLNNSQLPDGNLNDLIIGMKIDKEETRAGEPDSSTHQSRAQYVRRTIERQEKQMGKRRPVTDQPRSVSAAVNLFDGEALNIFTDIDQLKESPDILLTWKRLQERELKLAVTHPPKNYFEKMILWTEQGKLWKFPIDNEQGMDTEAKTSFVDHVFLEQYLEGWCPERGPIRHFMELVCVGLSKNHHLPASDKKDHIMWYKEYFESKKDLLKTIIIDSSEKQSIEATK